MAVISKRRRLGRQSLQEYLVKAGYEVPSEHVKRFAFRMVMILFLVLSTIIIALAAANGAYTTDILLFVLGFWTAVFAGVMLLVMAGTYFFLDYRIYRRTKEIEDVFPDFLQLSSSNIAAGMPVDRALWYAIRPGFGVLAKEMEEVAKATMTGEDLETSLLRFAEKYNSNTIRRSINILIEGMRAGGEIAELLNKIALNIDDMKIMRKEMAANVTTYAIFITFAAVVIAPFLFALATELLIIITRITGSLDLASTTTIFSFSAPDPSAIWNFKVFSVVMLTVTTVFSAAIVSIIKHGRVMEGIKTMPVYAVISLVIYYIATLVLQNVFSAIV
jgi:flagellar protein FlaJ